MDQGMALEVFNSGMKTILIISLPMLLTALTVGLIIAVFQATTQIQEQTLAFVPKIIGVFMVLMFAGPWIFQTLIEFTLGVFNHIDLLVL